MRWRYLIWMVFALAAASAAAGPQPHRILVKLKPELATDAEESLRRGGKAIESANPTQTPRATVSAFMLRDGVAQLQPLYPGLIRAKLSGVTPAQVAEKVRSRFAARAQRYRGVLPPPDLSRTYVVEPAGTPPDVAGTLARLRVDANVEYAELEVTYKTCDLPNDPYLQSAGSWGQQYRDLWGLYDINAPNAWSKSAGRGMVVAVVDTGIDLSHLDIAANVWSNPKEIAGNGADDDGNGYVDDTQGWNFVAGSNNPTDDYGHGTHVAGTIAAVGNNGLGVIGVAWQARVMALKALDATGNGEDAGLAQALVYAANEGADVINTSWGSAGRSQTIADAIDYAYSLGAVIVAAAGNQTADARNFYPAALWDVITVSASDPTGLLADFSNSGSKIDVSAPGVDILSLQAANTALGSAASPGYCRLQGTSMAAPHVAGLAALLLAEHPEYSNEDVRQAIRISARGVAAGTVDLSFGYGHADAAAALAVTGVLEAKLNAPQDGQTVRGLTPISGVARGRDFAGYRLEFGLGAQPAVWTTLQSGTTPVDGLLGSFDATTVANGIYTIRLTAFNTAGQQFMDRIQLTAAPVAVTSPPPPAYPTAATMLRPGSVIAITGSVLSARFRGFRVEWARGSNPTSGWSTRGIVLAGDGQSPVDGGLIANWYTASVTDADYYTIRLSVDSGGPANQATTVVYLQPSLYSANWPQTLNRSPWPTVGLTPQADGAGSTRLMAQATNWGAPQSRSVLWTLPLDAPAQASTLAGNGSSSQVSAESFNGGAAQQLLVVRSGAGSGPSGGLALLSLDGLDYATLPAPGVEFGLAQPVIAQLERDRAPRIVAVGSGSYAGAPASIFVWLSDGSSPRGTYPVSLADNYGSRAKPYTGVRTIVGDVDGDGESEIVALELPAPSVYQLTLLAHDGTLRSWSAPQINGVPLAMAAADLDHNGKLETAVVSCVWDANQSFLTQPTLHVFQPDGSERPGWPVSLNNNIVTASYLAIGDLERNGRMQIVLSDQWHLNVFNPDGTRYPGAWPLEAPNHNAGFGPIVIGDIDGDGYPEVVTSRVDLGGFTPAGVAYYDQKLVALRRDGSTAQSWQLTNLNSNPMPFNAVPLIGDFDHDGLVEIAATWTLAAFGVSADVPAIAALFSTGAPYSPSPFDWPMIYQNPRNTAVLQPTPAEAGGGGGTTPYCTYLLSTGGAFIAPPGGTGAVSVTSAQGCSWAVSSPPPWIQLATTAASGSSTVNYSVQPNPGGARSAALTIAGRTFQVQQAGADSTSLPLAGSMPQIASGGGWDTELALFNAGSGGLNTRLAFVGNDGGGLNLKFTSPQSWLPGATTGSTLAPALQPHAVVSVSSSNPLDPAGQTGALQTFADGALQGYAVFTYAPTAQAAVVPLETRSASSYLLAYDNTGGLETGLAVANLAGTKADVAVVLRDDTGALIGTGTIALAAGGHASFMLNDAASGFPQTEGHRGTVQFSTPPGGRIGVLGLRTNQAALTTLPVLTRRAEGAGVLPHIATGGGWQTLITLVNSDAQPQPVTLSFRDDNGLPMELGLFFPQTGKTQTLSTVSATIPAGGTLLLQSTAGVTDPALTGSAQLIADENVNGFAIFRNAGQEAVAPLSSGEAQSATLVFDNTRQLATGIALASGSGVGLYVAATLRDEAGSVRGTATLLLPASGHVSKMLTSLFPTAANMRGSVEFAASGEGSVSALGIRAAPAPSYTSIPAFSGER